MTLRLRTFGGVRVERDGRPLGGAHSQRRRLALLAYLAGADAVAIRRDKLIALLWPESDEASGRHSLSQLLYAIRHDLGAEAIAVDSETVRLNPEVLTSDAREFEDALKAGRLEAAVELYRGVYLADFHVDGAPDLERWMDGERARLAFACGRALDRLAESSERSRDWHRAVEWLRRRVALDPSDPRATLRLMQALSATGDRDGALRVAHVYETLIRDDLEAEPDPAIVRTAADLRRVPPFASAAAAAASADVPSVQPSPRYDAEPATGQRSDVRRRPLVRIPDRQVLLAGIGLAVIVVATVLMARGRSDASTRPADANAIVVIGDLEGPDEVLALAVREALRAELTNTGGVILTSEQGIRELKTLMRLPADAPLQPPELLTLASRGGAHVAITGSVLPVGEGAQIVLELLDPATTRSIRTFAERPVSGAATLAAVDRLARLIGRDVSRAPRDTGVRPLPAVTTSSLPALKSYAQARQAASLGKRSAAIEPAERAVTHDSTFVLAHYLLGDLLWFLDEQTHAEAHLEKAYQLRATVPAREQLVIRARYEQLARDRPDSALAYWQLLTDASPGDVLAFEGRAWALRALGRHEEAAAAADTAMTLDPGALLPNTNNAMYSWLAVGDTANALAVGRRVAARYPEALVEARFYAALSRDPREALAWAESTAVPPARHWRRHHAQVAIGDVSGARVTLDSIVSANRMAYAPNALVNQGWVELVRAGDKAAAARYAREALAWTRSRDLSPPGVARLAERIADLGARAGDESLVRETIALVRQRDRGRSLRTYEMARATLDAALAYARGDFDAAADLARAARHGVYFSRSLATIVQLEADARRAAGQIAAADSLARLVATHQIVDGHFEAWMILRAVTAQARDSIRSTLVTVDIATERIDTVLAADRHFEAPNWSPDGRFFIVNSGGRLYRVSVRGERRLEEIPTGFATRLNNDHGITPDGRWLILSHHAAEHVEDPGQEWLASSIYVMPVDGSGPPRKVTARAPSFWHGVSPDGRTLAYVGRRDGEWDIYSIPTAGGQERRLTTCRGLDDGPDYSADGAFIYYNSFCSGRMQIWRMRSDGTGHEQLTDDSFSNWFPHPSPDGRWIVYLAYLEDQGESHPFGRQVKLRLMDTRDGSVRDLTQPFFGGQGTINVPSWSPDSRRVAFVMYAIRS